MKPRLGLLLVSHATVLAGAEEHVLQLLRGLDRRYFQLYLACTPELAGLFGKDLPSDVEIVRVNPNRLSDLRSVWRLRTAIHRWKIDILHSHMFRASLFASPLGWLCDVPVIIETPHVREFWRRGWLKSKYFVDRLVGKLVDHYIAVSSANARYLIEEKKLPARKIRVINNGCTVDRFYPDRSVPTGMRRALGIEEHHFVLVVLGRLEPQKGHHILLNAMPQILRQFPDARLVCVGDGALRTKLELQADVLGIREAVHFVGYQRNTPDWLALADVSVLPSNYEGLPLVAIESLAAGRPMVATAVDGTPDVVLDGKTGLTVPPGDSNRMAEAICRLLGDEELRRSFAVAGRRHVLQSFSVTRFVQETQEFYLSAWDIYTRQASKEQLGNIQEGGTILSNQPNSRL
jgi:glycosyltransferase involved in cell wall biosynthesis